MALIKPIELYPGINVTEAYHKIENISMNRSNKTLIINISIYRDQTAREQGLGIIKTNMIQVSDKSERNPNYDPRPTIINEQSEEIENPNYDPEPTITTTDFTDNFEITALEQCEKNIIAHIYDYLKTTEEYSGEDVIDA